MLTNAPLAIDHLSHSPSSIRMHLLARHLVVNAHSFGARASTREATRGIESTAWFVVKKV
jgi:hypothetical protein